MPDDTHPHPEDWDATPVATLHRQAIMAAVLATVLAVAALRGLVRQPGRAYRAARWQVAGALYRMAECINPAPRLTEDEETALIDRIARRIADEQPQGRGGAT